MFFRVLFVWIAAVISARAGKAAEVEIPFQYREGLLWVEVAVSPSRPHLNFLVDTGSGASVINLSTATRLGLKLGEKVTVHGVEGALPGYWQQRISAKVGEIELPHEYLAVDLEKLSRSCERSVDGLIGADFFRGRAVEIDFDAQKIRVLKSDKYRKADGSVPLELRSCGMRVPISVNGHKRQWMRLDTGCASALQWVTSTVKPAQCIGKKMAIGLVEVSIPQTQTTVGIAGFEFGNVPTGLHATAIFPGEAGLLGNGLLAQFSVVTVDAKAGRVFFHSRSSRQ